MKSILIILAAALPLMLFAQKPLNEVTLNYDISVQSTDGKTDLTKAFEGATQTLYIKGNLSRSDMKSTLGSESSIYDGRTSKGYIMKEYSGQKLLITLTDENWKQKNQYYQSLNFTLHAEETVINGFKVKKAVAQLPNGKELVVYYSTEITPVNKNYNNALRLPGVPVQYEVESGNLKFTYRLKSYNTDPVSSARFEIPKSGYRIMTYDENQQLKKGDKK